MTTWQVPSGAALPALDAKVVVKPLAADVTETDVTDITDGGSSSEGASATSATEPFAVLLPESCRLKVADTKEAYASSSAISTSLHATRTSLHALQSRVGP